MSKPAYLDPHTDDHLIGQYCKRCDAKRVPLIHNLCNKCWKELAIKAKETDNKCSYCGKPVVEQNKFCPFCC